MKIGIIGFAGSGKTTLFNALTGQDAPVGIGKNKINLGTIKVPDARLDRLAEIDQPQKTTYIELAFADVPGGRGTRSLDPQTLGRIREMDALVQVIRGFDNGGEPPEPSAECLSFEEELMLADMQVIEKRIERLRKDRSDPTQLGILERCADLLNQDQPLRELALSAEEKLSIAGFALLTLKPLLLVLSLPEDNSAPVVPEPLSRHATDRGLAVMPLCGPIEAEIAALGPDDQQAFLADLGLEEPAAARFIKAAFSLLNLITFFTHGEDECRAWSLRRGSTAVDAAGTIHSDLARGFIRVEVVRFEDFSRLGTEAKCRDSGVLRIEGKNYVIEDGDICHIRFNV